MSQEKSNFQLKPMYDGLPLEFGSQVFITNANITDENALKLLKNHPRGKELFEVLPENVDELLNSSQTPAGNQNAGVSIAPTSIKIFDKDYTIDEVKAIFENAEVKSNATSIKGLQRAFDAQSEEVKAKIKTLLADK